MRVLPLHNLHAALGAAFAQEAGCEIVATYGDPGAEHRAVRERAGLCDLSHRGFVALTGEDRQAYLHGMCTNDIKALTPGAGCHAAMLTGKGKMIADYRVHSLADGLLLDMEPQLAGPVAAALEEFLFTEDCQVTLAHDQWGLLGLWGPRAAEVLARVIGAAVPDVPSFHHATATLAGHLIRSTWTGESGWDLLVPAAGLVAVWEALRGAGQEQGLQPVGQAAFETLRLEAGVPRFGRDMDADTLPNEAGLEHSVISYTKGCYVGQETIARIKTYGHVNRELRGLRVKGDRVPERGMRLVREDKDAGQVTSAVRSPTLGMIIALAYLRRGHQEPGTPVQIQTPDGPIAATVTALPFVGKISQDGQDQQD